MNEDMEQRIRELAYSLWQSAERPYWSALEYWLMAEHMIFGLKFATNREPGRRMAPRQAVAPPPASSGAAMIAAGGDGAGSCFQNSFQR